jgi:glycosyltransferase involved in cell wall biosynthesis
MSFGERLIFFFPVADTQQFVNNDQIRQRARERLGLASDVHVVGNVGNINPMKGHDTFIHAAAELRRQRKDTRFVLLGATSAGHLHYAQDLWRTATELGLEFGRDLVVVDPGTDVAMMAPSFDIFWLTSNPRSEGIPTVVGEAMALSLPVVASRVGSVDEAVLDQVTGALVAPRDPRALVNATLPYLDDRSLREAVGQAARTRAEDLYSPKACAERHERAFELATRHRRQRQADAFATRAQSR